MPQYKRGSGSVYLKRGWCYIKYYANGKPVSEATGTKNKAEARRLLQARLGQLAEGRYVGPAADRVTFDTLAKGLFHDYKVNGQALSTVETRVRRHLRPFFGHRKAHEITTADVNAYIAHRQEGGAKNGSINRELAALKRMFNLALQAEKITRKPYIPSLEENNARQGFFERVEFEALFARLPEWLRPAALFSYQTGWRLRSEVLPITWSQIDLDAGTVRLEVGTTKNKEGRLVYLPAHMREVIESQWAEHLSRYPECPFVFHRNGKPVKKANRSWNRACQQAGLADKIPHDFRRTAVRNMVRAGIPERVAMQISGHKTRSVFDRYHIVADSDLQEAAQRLDQAFNQQTATILVTTPLPVDSGRALSH